LGLHWREPALHLARLFTDYEPGIHYSQVQMQSGTTGVNSIRIYNPIKQGMDHDPDGVFIRKWIPELAALSADQIHTPWQYPHLVPGYPLPIVDEKIARQVASAEIYSLRKEISYRQDVRDGVKKHKNRSVLKKPFKPAFNFNQMELPLWPD